MKYDRIYTRKGDTGMTTLWSGEQVEKSTNLIQLLAQLDIIHSKIGLARANAHQYITELICETVVEALISFMGKVASPSKEYIPDLQLDKLNTHMKDILAYHIKDREQVDWIRYGTTGIASAYIDDACTHFRLVESLLYEADLLSTPREKKFFNMVSKLLYLCARNEDVV